MKKVMSGLCLLASALFAAAVADAQSSGSGGAGSGSAGTSGASSATGTSGAGTSTAAGSASGTATNGSSNSGVAPTGGSSADPSRIQSGSSSAPGTAGAQQPGLPSAQQNQFNQPSALQPQTGPQSQSSDPGIHTRRNYDASDSRFGQSSGTSDARMSAPDRQAQGFDANMQTRGQGDEYGQYGTQSDSQRGQYGATGQGRRSELGVWLMTSGGPGIEIRQVTRGSAAEEIGLRPGDMIVGINGRQVGSPMEVQRLIRMIPPGQTAMLEVWRDGDQQEVSVTLQPMRERYQSAYRGDEMGYGSQMSSENGDLESRAMRLEQQLGTMMRELEQIRSDMARRPAGSSGQRMNGAFGSEQSAAQSDAGTFDDTSTRQESNEFNQFAAPPETSATEPESAATEFDSSTTEPSIREPSTTDASATESFSAEPSATEPSTTEPSASATEATPTETTPSEPTSAEPSETESTEDLFRSENTTSESETTPAAETESETEAESETATESDADLFQ